MRPRGWKVLLGLTLVGGRSLPVYAHHQLRQGAFDLLGPLAWGLYVMLPVPFVLAGVIAWRIYRVQRAEHEENQERRSR